MGSLLESNFHSIITRENYCRAEIRMVMETDYIHHYLAGKEDCKTRQQHVYDDLIVLPQSLYQRLKRNINSFMPRYCISKTVGPVWIWLHVSV